MRTPRGPSTMRTSDSHFQVTAFVAGAVAQQERATAALAAVPGGMAAAEQALVRVYARASREWVDFQLPMETFSQALGERWPESDDIATWLERVFAPDLYLALGCLAGNTSAINLLEARYFSRLAQELKRAGSLGMYVGEAHQQLRIKMLVPDAAGQLPRLSSYRGTGPLMVWLRLALTRLALNLREASVRHVDLDDELIQAPARDSDPELGFLRRTYAAELTKAMTDAFAALPTEERAILRMHFLDGLSAADVGSLFDVSGRTIQRRIVETRRAIVARTRAILSERLGSDPLGARLLETLMRLVDNDLEVSLRRVLQS